MVVWKSRGTTLTQRDDCGKIKVVPFVWEALWRRRKAQAVVHKSTTMKQGQYVGAHPTKTVEAIRKYSDDPERGHSRIRELAECEQAGGELRQEVWKSNQYSIICCKLHEANRKTIREKP